MATRKRKPKKSTRRKARGRKKTARRSKPIACAPSRKKLSGGLAKRKKPTATLARIIGNKPVNLPEALKCIWAYIKKHDLQKGRMIIPDDNLADLFGSGAKIPMFEMTAHVMRNLK